jgi:hypothetical protein
MKPRNELDSAEQVEVLLVEYEATQAAYLHYDGFRWQAGSFLIAGVFIFWGLVVQQPTEPRVGAAASFLVTGLMSTWLLFAYHYREIYMYKLRRIHEIELELGMEQHLRFRRGNPATEITHRVSRPRGHELDLAVYLLTVLGTPLLAGVRDTFSIWYLASIPVIVVALYLAQGSERAAKAGTGLNLGANQQVDE